MPFINILIDNNSTISIWRYTNKSENDSLPMDASIQPQFDVNIKGRVNNIKLPQGQYLMPIFDAVVNSFQAIGDHSKKCQVQGSTPEKYYIHITALYDKQRGFDEEGDIAQDKITGFVIEDNGIGFDEENFASFRTSDSSYKELDGGRGVGRFLWLKEFETVSVDSTYQGKDGRLRHRHFNFGLDKPYISNFSDVIANDHRHTIVKLDNLRKEYSKLSSKKIDEIAMKIVEYCLSYFLKKDCPSVTISGEADRTVNLNNLFNEKINADSQKVTFTIGSEMFTLLHVMIEDPVASEHKLHLMADERDVSCIKLNNVIVDLKFAIEKSGRNYWYAGFLNGDYLDYHVNENRTRIEIDDNDPISEEMIVKKASIAIEKYFQPNLEQVREEKKIQINDFIMNNAPEYRALIKYKSDDLNGIEPGLSEDKLDDSLYKIKRDFEKEIEKDTKEILKNVKNPMMDGNKAFDDLMETNLKKINEANRSTLAKYITRRKAVLDLLTAALDIQDNSKYQRERYIHEMIFPTRKSLDDLPEDQYNLWLIDEKLAFFFYLDSDKPFNNNPHEKRPDLLCIDKPIAVSEDAENLKVHDTIVIFEFKQPNRDDYDEKNNPIKQLYDYARKIQKGDAKDPRGRTINVSPSTKYYLYAICDLTPSLEALCNDYDNVGMRTPDGRGRFWHIRSLNAYVEVIPLPKMIDDSKRRNEILFKKLGI